MAVNDILRSSSEDVEGGQTWWWLCFRESEDKVSLMSVCVHLICVHVYIFLYC